MRFFSFCCLFIERIVYNVLILNYFLSLFSVSVVLHVSHFLKGDGVGFSL